MVVPALAWHRCLAIQSGSKNSLFSHGRKPLQNTKPFPLSLPFPWRWGAFRSFLALFGTLLPSLAFQYHGTHVATGFFLSHRWGFPPFLLPHHRASLSSLCPLAHTFLPCGPKLTPRWPELPRASFLSQHGYHLGLEVPGLEIPQFWGSVPPCVGGTPPGSTPTDAETCVQYTSKPTLAPTSSSPKVLIKIALKNIQY